MWIDFDSWVSFPLRLFRIHSRQQISDIARGLSYLHSNCVVHGDLNEARGFSKFCFATLLTLGQSNVVVDDSGHARIIGYGIAGVDPNLDFIQNAWSHIPPWIAPEFLNGNSQKKCSKEADVFAFAMVVIEVRTDDR